MKNYDEIVSKHWAKMVRKNETMSNWTDSELVRKYVNKCQTGNENLGWLEYACDKYIIKKKKGVKSGLSVGCGSGILERQCRKKNVCETIDAFDISNSSIIEAKKNAENEGISGINYQVQNLEKFKFLENSYDVVFASSSVHHISNLENFFKNIRNCLTSNGLFIMAEYVGPSRFQMPRKQVEIINEILQALESQYKIIQKPFTYKNSFTVPSIKYMIEHDPSESVRSSEIIPVLSKYFKILEKNDYGGTVLHMLLRDIMKNFTPDNYKDKTVLSLLILLEKMLINEKVLESDFSFVIAQKSSN